MSTSATRPCAVCSKPAATLCSGCKSLPLCSTKCQKALYTTHDWICSKDPNKRFSFPPLDDVQMALLKTLPGRSMSNEQVVKEGNWPKTLRGKQLWDEEDQDLLLRRWQELPPDTPLAEPRRSLLLAHLRHPPRNVPRNGVSASGVEHVAVWLVWTREGSEALKQKNGKREKEGDENGYVDERSIEFLTPVLRAVLIYATLHKASLTR